MAYTYDENLTNEAEKLIRTSYYGMLQEFFFALEGMA